MATFAELEATNPQIRMQFREWLDLCEETDEDFTDYQAFRQHVIFRGSPDPGEAPIEDFLTADGVPNESTWRHSRGPAGARLRPEEADASASARPISDAEAAQLGSPETLDERLRNADVSDRSEPDGDGAAARRTDEGAVTAPPPPEPPLVRPRAVATPAPAVPATPEPQSRVPHRDTAPITGPTFNGSTAAVGGAGPVAHPSSWSEAQPAPEEADGASSSILANGGLKLAAVVLLLLGFATGAWWLIQRRRRSEANRISVRARHLTSAAASRTSEAAETVAEAATMAGRRTRQIGTTLAAEGERILKQTTRAAHDAVDSW